MWDSSTRASCGRNSGCRADIRATSASRYGGIGATVWYVDGAGTSLWTWAYATWIGVSPVCGLRPVSNSNSTTPRL